MYKVCTRSKKEALETGKIYLDDAFYFNFPVEIKKPKRCKNCAGIIGNSVDKLLYYRGLCSEICSDELSVNEYKLTLRKCANEKCQNLVEPIKRKDGTSSGVYPKYCKEIACRNGRLKKKILSSSKNNLINKGEIGK